MDRFDYFHLCLCEYMLLVYILINECKCAQPLIFAHFCFASALLNDYVGLWFVFLCLIITKIEEFVSKLHTLMRKNDRKKNT